jgi:acyl-[acyl carrier protein]--UDP-N-acetylglucosamine O-acyltransferase
MAAIDPTARIEPGAVIGQDVSIGTIDGSSFSGLLTRVEIGNMRIRPAGKGRIKSRGSGSSPSQRA